MMKSTLLASLLALVPLCAVTGCAEDRAEESEGFGQVRMALEGTAASGVVYRLMNAQFAITGPESEIVAPPDEATSAQLDLPAGFYDIELSEGWSLVRVNSDDSLTPVDATLVSSNPEQFSIADGAVTSVQFVFDAGETVLFGEGTLDLSIGIVTPEGGFSLGRFDNGVTGADFNVSWSAFDSASTQIVSDPGAPAGNGYLATTITGTDLQNARLAVVVANQNLTLDGSEILSFWYRGTAAIQFEFHTPQTTDQAVLPQGTCVTNCWDGFKQVTPASSNWTKVYLPISHFAQAGSGTPATDGLERVLLIYVTLTGNTPGSFDLDEIRIE